MATQRVTVEIIGLGCCGGGALTVERALAGLAGVRHAYVNSATETAYVEYDSLLVSSAELVLAVERSGFGAGAPILR